MSSCVQGEFFGDQEDVSKPVKGITVIREEFAFGTVWFEGDVELVFSVALFDLGHEVGENLVAEFDW